MPPTLSKTEVLTNGYRSQHQGKDTAAHDEQDAPVQPEHGEAIEDHQDKYEAEEEEDFEEESSTRGFKNLPALPQYLSQPRSIQALLSAYSLA